jgi:p-cumate 2,3-dioxygenase alpha subunit
MTMVSNHPDAAMAPTRFPLVDDDAATTASVHRDTMTSPEIFREEAERIFSHSWLYVGHNQGGRPRATCGGRSEQAGLRGAERRRATCTFSTTPAPIAGRCVNLSRQRQGLQCFIAWTFDSDGRLTGVPDREAYGAKLDFSQLGLRPVARVENYRGFVFASFDENVTDLVTYLAGAREYLDLVIDSGDGEMEIVKGTNEYCIGANWKLLAENSIDGYHAVSTHDTYFKYLVALGTDLKGGVQGTARDLGNGHAVLEYAAPWGRPIAKWEPLFGEHARQEIAVLRAGLVGKYGKERASRIADVNRNLLIYPNLVVNDIVAITVRTFMPSAPDRMDVTAWEMAPRDELPALRQRRLDSFLTFLGPAGFATPDDLEALESCQQGFSSGGVEWNDISRGMDRVPQANDEAQMRAFWRQWQRQMGDAACKEVR